MNRAVPLFCLLMLTGCVGDPDLGSGAAELELELPVPRIEWEAAVPGCEGIAGPGSRLRPVEGEALLAAVVGPRGQIQCVDSTAVLLDEVRPRVERDPTPTPLIEGVEVRVELE